MSVSIDADRVVRSSTVRVEIVVEAEVEDPSGGRSETWATLLQLTRKQQPGDDAEWPWQFKLDSEQSRHERYSLIATARDDRGAVVARAQAIRDASYVRRKGLRVHFDGECFRRAELCEEGSTCAAGACVDATNPAATVEDGGASPTGEPQTPSGGVQGPADGLARENDACTDGARACADHGSRTPLLCEGGSWRAQTQCLENERCNTAFGLNRGTCLPIADECKNRQPGTTYCEGETMRVCMDLTESVIRPCAEFEQCVPEGSSARCACRLGYVKDPNGGRCTRADACGSNGGGCDPLTQCSMKTGVRTCTACPGGYTGSGEAGCAPLLQDLAVDAGQLEPAVQASARAYRIRLPLLAQRVTLKPVVPPDTNVTFNGAPLDPSGSWQTPVLQLGETTFPVVLTSIAGVRSEYTLTVERTGEQEAYIKSSNADPGDAFGFGVDISGDTMVATAWFEDSSATGVDGNQDDNGSTNSGAAYVFVREAGGWKQQAYLKPSDTRAESFFGVRAAIDGDTIVVGALAESIFQPSVAASRPGAAYVFTRRNGVWSETQRLAATQPDGADLFGAGVAIDGDTIAVGAPWESTGVNDSGAVYIYERNGERWVEKQIVKSRSPGVGASFGSAVAIDRDRMVIGSPNDDRPASRTGSADVFVRRDGSWIAQQFLKPDDLDSGASFGFMVDVHGDRIVVGVPRTPAYFSPAPTTPGEVQVFELAAGEWVRSSVLHAPVPRDSDAFGIEVKLGESLLVVGASGDSSGARGLHDASQRPDAPLSGAVHLYAPTPEGWTHSAYIKPHNTNPDDAFGYATAFDGETLVVTANLESSAGRGVGASGAEDASRSSGSVYVFR